MILNCAIIDEDPAVSYTHLEISKSVEAALHPGHRVCFLLQLGAYAVTRVKRRFHGLTYFPSFLLLALIADVPTHVDTSVSLGWWWLVLPFSLLGWAGVMWVVRPVSYTHLDVYKRQLSCSEERDGRSRQSCR